MTERDVVLFTEITGGHNPIHHDDELAAASRFGSRVVQGGTTVLDGSAVVWRDPVVGANGATQHRRS